MSKEELIQFEGLVIEILPDARYRVQLDDGCNRCRGVSVVAARRRKPQSERPNCIFDLAWMMVRFARGPDDCATHGDPLQGPAGRLPT